MFMGQYAHKIDTRDRMSIPARMRDELYRGSSEHPIITAGFEKCLFLYPMDRWRKFSEEAESLKTSREDSRKLERFLFSYACECPCDPQGRIIIPRHLCEYSGLKQDVIIIGVRHRIELWDRVEWESQAKLIRDAAVSIAEKNDGFTI